LANGPQSNLKHLGAGLRKHIEAASARLTATEERPVQLHLGAQPASRSLPHGGGQTAGLQRDPDAHCNPFEPRGTRRIPFCGP